jgi:hypothetical protein
MQGGNILIFKIPSFLQLSLLFRGCVIVLDYQVSLAYWFTTRLSSYGHHQVCYLYDKTFFSAFLPRWEELNKSKNKTTNSMALVREWTISIERPPLVGEVTASFCVYRESRGQRNGSQRKYSRFSRLEPLLSLPSSSSIVIMRLSGPRSRPTISQKMLVAPGIEPGTSGSVTRNSDQ